MTYRVKFATTEACRHANRALMREYPPKKIPDRADHIKNFEEKYDVKVVKSAWGDWTEIEFENEQDYTWFLLRWAK